MFESSAGRFKVTFCKHLIKEELSRKHELSQRQLLAIDYIKDHGSISNTEYRTIKGFQTEQLLEILKK